MSTNKRRILAIVVGLVLVIGIAAGYLINSLQNPDVVHSDDSASTWKEPPALTSTLNTKEDYLNDLRTLGCFLIHAHLTPAYGGPGTAASIIARNYTEFRRFAFNSKVVFYDSPSTIRAFLFVPYNGYAFFWDPQ